MTGVARGKIVPKDKFISEPNAAAEAVLIQTVTGDYPDDSVLDPVDADMDSKNRIKTPSALCPGRWTRPRRSSLTATSPMARCPGSRATRRAAPGAGLPPPSAAGRR